MQNKKIGTPINNVLTAPQVSLPLVIKNLKFIKAIVTPSKENITESPDIICDTLPF